MRTPIALAAKITLAACTRAGARDEPAPPAVASAAEPGFAVLELFTSEGCSSCPPADALLRHLEAEHADEPVYVLAFHVDYWNDLGWADPWSRAAFSERQRAYARVLDGGVFTPELVVNGKAAMVGSNDGAVRESLAAALGGSGVGRLELRAERQTASVALDFALHDVPRGAVVHVALVEQGLESHVASGENAGLTLAHPSVVRAFATPAVDRDARGHAELPLPTDATDALAAIAFAQELASGAIVAAARARLPQR